MIPRILHQSYKTVHHPYPRSWQRSWIERHPDWLYCFYTDADNRRLVRDRFPEFLRAFDAFPRGIMRADFSRFLYLYLWGGIYVDLDYVCLKPFVGLLEERLHIAIPELPGNTYYRYHNALLISEGQNPFWLKCAEQAVHYFQEEKHPKVEWLAGPFRLQAAIESEKLTFISLPRKQVTPIDWFALVDWGRPEKEVAALRQRLRESNLDAMGRIFPQAYALTFWEHQW